MVSPAEKEIADLAKSGLKLLLRERLEGQKFTDLFSLIAFATKYENLWKEKDTKPYKDYKQNMALVDSEDNSKEEINQDKAIEMAMAEMTLHEPYVCQALKPARVKETVMPSKSVPRGRHTEEA
ncbi:hypothetical protein NL676_019596 [Syzygium grande]|nr:hypothetical protein NL676_019596 [Syzygium grande]